MTFWRFLTHAGSLVLVALLLSGCNGFDALDTSLVSRPVEDRIAEGNLALGTGEFSRAREIFDLLYGEGHRSNDVLTGRGEAMAGAAGFNLLTSLDILQNGSGPYDRAPVVFGLGRMISNRDLLANGIAVLGEGSGVHRADKLARGLWAAAFSARLLLDKFDTNRNGRFDQADQISFVTNDGTDMAWPEVYRRLVTGPVTSGETLETAFFDLYEGFNGRGTNWTFLSPLAGTLVTGTFTDSNRNTVLAVSDLVDRIEFANTFYEINEASFTAAIRNLDGAEAQ